MGWKDPELQGCQTIFYFDGHYEPNQIQHPYAFLDMAADIRRSDVGLAQVRHYDPDRTPLQEFEAILRFQKDIPKNVEASVKWFQAQPDFFNNCTLYANYYFGTYFLLVLFLHLLVPSCSMQLTLCSKSSWCLLSFLWFLWFGDTYPRLRSHQRTFPTGHGILLEPLFQGGRLVARPTLVVLYTGALSHEASDDVATLCRR